MMRSAGSSSLLNVYMLRLAILSTVLWLGTSIVLLRYHWEWSFWLLTLSYGSTLATAASFTVGFFIAKRILLLWLRVAIFAVTPFIKLLQLIPFLRRGTEVVLMIYFFGCFRALLLFDVFIRRSLRLISQNRHASGRILSIVNSCDPNFEPLNEFKRDDISSEAPPGYNEAAAITLGNLARIVYEDHRLIGHELRKAGYDPASISLINYRNTCGVVAKRDKDIIVSFRGTDPLNLMSLYTDSRMGMVSLTSLDRLDEEGKSEDAPYAGAKDDAGSEMGKVHYGFAEAMRLIQTDGASTPKRKLKRDSSRTEIQPENDPLDSEGEVEEHLDDEDALESDDITTITLSNQTFGESLKSAFFGFFTILRFAWTSLILHSSDPIDTSFAGRGERNITAYEQAVEAIEELFEPGMHVYICGHSLGGALCIIFFAQAVHERRRWLEQARLYTYGAPRVGDDQFADFMMPFKSHMFHIVNNNDVVARIPWKRREIGLLVPSILLYAPGASGKYEVYSDNPGVIVFIDGASGRILMDPPTIRGISLTKLSGILNSDVLLRMRNENIVRIILRLIAPFFLNDHVPCDYVQMLKLHRRLRTEQAI